jgi:hypothetical protein
VKFETISHWRTGTNLLRTLLYQNFDLDGGWRSTYVNHVPPWRASRLMLGTLRPIVPTLFSMWRIRTRQGVHRDVGFAAFLRTPYNRMRRASAAAAGIVDSGKESGRINRRAVRELEMTPPQYWVYCSKHAVACAACHCWYDELAHNPVECMVRIAAAAGVPRKPVFVPVRSKVGVWATDEEEIPFTEADLMLMHRYQARFDRWYAQHRETKAYPYDWRHYRWYVGRWKQKVKAWQRQTWQLRRFDRLQLARGETAVVK